MKQAYCHRKNQDKVIPVEKNPFYFRKKGCFLKFSHLNEIYAFRYQIRERHACKRGQLTWLDCFEQKYLSIYLSQENLFENGCIYIQLFQLTLSDQSFAYATRPKGSMGFS